MSDEQTPATTDQAQGAEASAAADGPKYVTADDLKAFGDSMAANMRRMMDGVRAPRNGKGKEAEADKADASSSQDVASLMRLRDDINDALDDHPHLTKGHKKHLRELVEWKKPDNVAEFIAQHSATLFGKPTASVPARTAAAPPSQPPVSDAGGPAAPAKITDDVPLWQLSDEDRKAAIRAKGLGWYANTLRSQLKGVRVKVR
jgi:hypothetical protein